MWTQPWEPPAQWEEYQRTVATEHGTAYAAAVAVEASWVPGGVGVQGSVLIGTASQRGD